jgi:hypothetical protein
MRCQVWFVLLVGLVGLGRAESPSATPPKVKGPSFSQVDKVPLLSLAGSSEQIGQQEAKLVGDRAKTLLSFGPTLIRRRAGEAGWKAHAVVSRALLTNASQSHRDEIAAFQKASGLPQDELVASQTIYDTINAFGCSSILVPIERSSTGGPLFGRNFDYASLGLLHANDLVKIVRPEGKFAFASVSFPGCFGVISGMNEHGLSIALHEVRQAADGSTRFNAEGVPTLLALRQVLEECRTVDEAKALLTKLPRTTMYNLALCDPSGGAVLEVTTKNVILRKGEGINACTNHFRAKELCIDKTCQRFDSLMAKESRPYTVGKVFAKLDSANQGERTFQSMVFEPKALVMHVAIEERPSTRGTLRKLDLKELFAK